MAFAGDLDSAAPLISVAAVLVLVETAMLTAQARLRNVGVFGALAAILGNAVMTSLGFVVVAVVALFIACSGGKLCFG